MNSKKLTPREKKIIQLLLKGLIQKQIAVECNISVRTVETHMKNIHQKTGTKNASDVILWAIKNRNEIELDS